MHEVNSNLCDGLVLRSLFCVVHYNPSYKYCSYFGTSYSLSHCTLLQSVLIFLPTLPSHSVSLMSSNPLAPSYASLLTTSSFYLPKTCKPTHLHGNPSASNHPDRTSTRNEVLGGVSTPTTANPTPKGVAHSNASPRPGSSLATIRINSPQLDESQVRLMESTCLFGKSWVEFVPHAAVVNRLKRDWKLMRGEVCFRVLGNDWFLLSSPLDKYEV